MSGLHMDIVLVGTALYHVNSALSI